MRPDSSKSSVQWCVFTVESRNTERFTAVFAIGSPCVRLKRQIKWISDRNANTRITPLTDDTWKNNLVEHCYSYPPTQPWLLLYRKTHSVRDRKTRLCSSSGRIMPEMTHSRPPLIRLNYTEIAWYCPQAVTILRTPRGASLLCEF